MKTKIEIKEKLVELYYYLSNAMLEDDHKKVNKLRLEINNLLKLYLLVIEEQKLN